ncbi:MAG: PglD-related sugar-binding protein [Bacteroidia bacterium]
MKAKQIVIVGAGGHAKVVTEIISLASAWHIAAYVDEYANMNLFLDKPVFRNIQEFKKQFPQTNQAFVAIGNNDIREKWHKILNKEGYHLPWFQHSSSVISPSAQIGGGTLISSHVSLGPDCKIAEGVIINCGAQLDHDTTVGAFSHIRQCAVICGGATVESNVNIGPGCVVERMAIVKLNTSTIANSIVTPQ